MHRVFFSPFPVPALSRFVADSRTLPWVSSLSFWAFLLMKIKGRCLTEAMCAQQPVLRPWLYGAPVNRACRAEWHFGATELVIVNKVTSHAESGKIKRRVLWKKKKIACRAPIALFCCLFCPLPRSLTFIAPGLPMKGQKCGLKYGDAIKGRDRALMSTYTEHVHSVFINSFCGYIRQAVPPNAVSQQMDYKLSHPVERNAKDTAIGAKKVFSSFPNHYSRPCVLLRTKIKKEKKKCSVHTFSCIIDGVTRWYRNWLGFSPQTTVSDNGCICKIYILWIVFVDVPSFTIVNAYGNFGRAVCFSCQGISIF